VKKSGSQGYSSVRLSMQNPWGCTVNPARALTPASGFSSSKLTTVLLPAWVGPMTAIWGL